MAFKSGFVNIVGRPNAGKSTLMNALVGERMAIISPKPQTTRHRIIGILTGDDYQVVFSDTPGYIEQAAYKMHEIMNTYVESCLEDADVMLFVLDASDPPADSDGILDILTKARVPVLIALNKVDLVSQEQAKALMAQWRKRLGAQDVVPVVAHQQIGVVHLKEKIIELLPEGMPFYPADQLTDRPERFFVSEIIREKIFLQYAKEIPYASDVAVEDFIETQTRRGEPLVKIRAIVFVERKSQVAILIGKEGRAMKRLATAARKDLEDWLRRKVFLDITVKVRPKWRQDERTLRRWGYH